VSETFPDGRVTQCGNNRDALKFPASGSRQINAAKNVERVRTFMNSHLGCSPKEVAFALDLSGDQARRAFRKIRSEWARGSK
jgi:hypothetical protein